MVSRVETIELFIGFMQVAIFDERMKPLHISFYAGLVYLSTSSNGVMPIRVTRIKLMKVAKINSVVTYHKIIAQLELYGYIKYQPSYNRFEGSRIYLI